MFKQVRIARRALLCALVLGLVAPSAQAAVWGMLLGARLLDWGVSAAQSAPPGEPMGIGVGTSQKWASALNEKLPMEMGEGVALIRSEAIGAGIIELSVRGMLQEGEQMDRAELDRELAPALKNAFCSGRGFWSVWLTAGGTVVVRVSGKDGVIARGYSAQARDCMPRSAS